MTVTQPPAEVERQLREHVRRVRSRQGTMYKWLVGPERFWSAAAGMAIVTALDEPGECQRIACEAAERHGLGIAVGWCLDLAGRPCWHCCNLDGAGQLVDAGRERHLPGFLGKSLSESEEAALTRAAGLRTGEEVQQSFAALGRQARSLGSLFG